MSKDIYEKIVAAGRDVKIADEAHFLKRRFGKAPELAFAYGRGPAMEALKKCDYMGCPKCHPWRQPAKPDAECVQDALDKEDDLRDQIANGGC